MILINCLYALIAFFVTFHLCGNKRLHDVFIKSGLSGRDLAKRGRPVIPESFGVVAGTAYLVCLFLFIPIPFWHWYAQPTGQWTPWQLYWTWQALWQSDSAAEWEHFPYDHLATYLSALLSLTCMIFLGFADDVFDMPWRIKIWLPAIASIPLLMVYYVTYGGTSIVVPVLFRWLFGRLLDLGALYYVYMSMVAIFCTHSINILAGINGLEVGQSLILSFAVICNDLLFVLPFGEMIVDRPSLGPLARDTHMFSLCLLIPFFAVSLALFLRNRYPAQVFVGDTYCYFAGMTFAVVGILGHFSKTLLLFFIPQIFNFLYSCPQLFRFVPCPRHRLPNHDEEQDVLFPSTTELYNIREAQKPATLRVRLAALMLRFLHVFGLVQLIGPLVSNREETKTVRSAFTWSGRHWIACSNLTLINLVLHRFGAMHEGRLCQVMMWLQFFFGLVVPFTIRYGVVHLFFY